VKLPTVLNLSDHSNRLSVNDVYSVSTGLASPAIPSNERPVEKLRRVTSLAIARCASPDRRRKLHDTCYASP
jgi:hypothetical protein